MVSINGVLEPVAGAAVATALNAFMPPQPNDERTGPQRRADALTEICQCILRTDQPPANGGHRPQLLTRVTLDSLTGTGSSPRSCRGASVRWAALTWPGSPATAKFPDGTITARLGPKEMICKPNPP